ncbi:UNVERIFIED_CONTAM: hypothetical protein FKN15_050357 [Acipenser sinensis]
MLHGGQSSEALLLFPYPEDEESLLFSASALWGEGGPLSEALLPLVELPSSGGSPQPLVPWPCYLRYKTELCTRYTETGTCNTVPAASSSTAQRSSGGGGGGGGPPPNRRQPHSKYKTEPCRSYRSSGFCSFGSRCNFVHEEEEGGLGAVPRSSFSFSPGQGRPTHQQWKQQRSVPCRTFLAFGFCLYGARCRYKHSVVKSQPEPASNTRPASPSLPPSIYSLGLSYLALPSGRAPSPASDGLPCSSSCSSVTPDYHGDSPSPVPPEPLANNAFTFTSQHITDLLLPLAWKLQDLENRQRGLSPEPGSLELLYHSVNYTRATKRISHAGQLENGRCVDMMSLVKLVIVILLQGFSYEVEEGAEAVLIADGMADREERKFAEVPRDSVKLMAESVGVELSDDIAAMLAEDVCYRLREAAQNSSQFMRHAKRRRLTVEDFNRALRWSNVEAVCGYGSQDALPFRPLKEGELYFVEDREINLVELALATNIPKGCAETMVRDVVGVIEGLGSMICSLDLWPTWLFECLP